MPHKLSIIIAGLILGASFGWLAYHLYKTGHTFWAFIIAIFFAAPMAAAGFLADEDDRRAPEEKKIRHKN